MFNWINKKRADRNLKWIWLHVNSPFLTTKTLSEEIDLDLASAEMKSTKDGWPPSKLIDGDKGSVAHTDGQAEDHGLWIRVNLAKCSSVTKVIVYNRGECQQRIIGASLFIKTGDEYVTDCGKFDSAKSSYTFDCRGNGNRIEISQNGRVEHPWNLAEIEVYGTSGNSVCQGWYLFIPISPSLITLPSPIKTHNYGYRVDRCQCLSFQN